MALVAIEPAGGDILAVVRLHGDANHVTAEYAIAESAIIVRSDQQGQRPDDPQDRLRAERRLFLDHRLCCDPGLSSG